MRPSQLEAALMFHGQYRQPVIALSAPGKGKSTIFRKVFNRLGLSHYTMNLALSDGTDNRGLPTFIEHDGGKAVQWAKERHFLTKDPFALFVDETFQGQTQVLNVMAPVFLENRMDDIFFPHGTWVCGASNRLEDKAGTNRVPSHIPNRVTILEGPDTSIDDWSEYMLDQGRVAVEMAEYQAPLAAPTERDFRVVQFCRMKPSALNDFKPERLVNATERQWEWVAQFYPVIPSGIVVDVVAGRVGAGYAAELHAFCKLQDKLPTKEEILLNPKKAKVPDSPSGLYLVSGMLAQASNKGTFDAVCMYAERIPHEFQAMLVKDALRMAPEIASTKAFTQWGIKFAQVLR